MKTNRVVGLALAIVVTLVFMSCENPFEDKKDDDNGTAPVIEDVQFFKDTNYQPEVLEFTVGDDLYFLVFSYDPDRDMKTLELTVIDPNSQETTNLLDLPSTSNDREVWGNISAIIVEEPTGNYVVKTTIVDAAGNRSNTWTSHFAVNAP